MENNMLKIYKSNKKFSEIFIVDQRKLQDILGNICVIEHVGSTAVPKIDGKGIIDVLIGFDDKDQMQDAVTKLKNNGYFLGRDYNGYQNHIFMASSKDDTTVGDTHLHLALKNSKDFSDFIKIRDFFRQNPEQAKKYSKFKYEIAKKTNYDREEYKKIKSQFIGKMLKDVDQFK